MRLQSSGLLALCVVLGSCSLTPGGREAKHLAKGKSFFAQKDYRRSAIEFRVASQNAEKDPEPHYCLGLVYRDAGNPVLAGAEFGKALRLNANYSLADFEMAKLRTAFGDPDELRQARQSLERFGAANPENSEAWGALALVEVKMGLPEAAQLHLKRATALKPTDAGPVSAVLLYQISHRDLAGAKTIAEKAVEQMPKSPEAALLLAKVLLVSGQRQAADAEMDRVLRLEPKFRPALQLRLNLLSGEHREVEAESTAKALADLPERGTATAYATFLMHEGKISLGIEEFRRQLSAHPDDTSVAGQFAAILIGLDQKTEADTIVHGILKRQPKDPDALLMSASLRIDARDYSAADRLLTQVEQLKPNSGAVYYQRSRIAESQGRARREGDLLVEALRRNRGLLSARLELARLLLDAGNSQRAIGLLEAATPLERQTPMCRFYYAGAMMATQQWDKARAEVDQGLSSVRIAPLLNLDASLRFRQNDLEGARQSLEEGLKEDRANLPSWKLLGSVFHAQNKDDEFFERIRSTLNEKSTPPSLRLFAGDLLASKGDRNGARAAYESAKSAQTHFVAADLALARLDLQEQAPDRARQRLLTALKMQDTAALRDLLGGIEENAGHWDQAARDYRAALEFSPGDAMAMNNLASVLAQHLGKVNEALGFAERAKALSPDSPFVQDTLGCIYLQKGNTAGALEQLQNSAKLYNRATVRYHLAQAYLRAGDRVKAQEEYGTAVKMDPKSPERGNIEASLQRP